VAALLACGAAQSATPSRALATRGIASPAATAAAITTVATGAASTAQYPAQVLDLANWKLTLPVNAGGATIGVPLEIQQPALATYTQEPYFRVLDDGVQFRAPVNGVTTSGSRYPRSELREMTNNGTRQASWSTTEGVHTMVIDQAITAVPAAKPHVVAGQIHDATDDVLTIRLEQPRLFVDHNGTDGATLTSSYVLGTRFTVTIQASEGAIKVYYNGSVTPADTLPLSGGGNYFKAGVYTQSNCTRERTCTLDNFGEVVIYHLTVTHQ
jgi:hypothetical protein